MIDQFPPPTDKATIIIPEQPDAHKIARLIISLAPGEITTQYNQALALTVLTLSPHALHLLAAAAWRATHQEKCPSHRNGVSTQKD